MPGIPKRNETEQEQYTRLIKKYLFYTGEMLLLVLEVFTNHRVDLMKKMCVSFYISFVQSGGKLLKDFSGNV